MKDKLRHWWSKLAKSTAFWLGLIIVVQTVVYVVAGQSKAYIHMDEAYSLALAQYDKIDITANEDFYNTWHMNDYYQDYLAVQEKDRGNWQPVYENQKNDVHPPLYYGLLRGAMELGDGRFSKWPGIILNLLIMAGSTILLYLCISKLFKDDKNGKFKALVVTLVAGLTVASISTVVYIRMYALLTLMVLLTLWLHLKMREQSKPKVGMYFAIFTVVILGTLTQYYYLFFLFGLVIQEIVHRASRKQWRELAQYLGVLAMAGVTILVIWPHILQHMFFGYRGQGALGNLLNPVMLVKHLWDYVLLADYNVFHHLLLVLVVIIVGIGIYRKVKGIKMPKVSVNFWLIFWPTVSYFSLAAVASPFRELRYIMPVCGLIFVLVMYGMYRMFDGMTKERTRASLMLGVMMTILIVLPMQINLGWMRIELLYRDRQAVMTAVEAKPEVPILYFITTANNRFLDNILPFTIAQESYLALDLDDSEVAEVKKILQGKDLSQGLFVWISDQQDHDVVLRTVKEATGLESVKWVQGVNTCDVYYLE